MLYLVLCFMSVVLNREISEGEGRKALKKRWRIHSFCGAQQCEKSVGDVTTLDCIRL